MVEGYGTVLALTNAAAGGTDDERVAAALSVLRTEVEVRRAHCCEPADLERALDERDGAVVVVFGGDGSLHATVAALHRRGELAATTLGLVPLGTGNDLARTLGIPLDPADAARHLLAAAPRRLDLLLGADGGASGIVVNVVHLGVGAEAAAKAAALKSGLGAAAYPVGGVLAGLTTGGWDLRVEVDGATLPVEGRALMVAVANGRTIGGGAQVAPDAEPDDGLLDVVVATSTGPLARLGFGTALREGKHVERDDVLSARGRQVRVHGEPVPANADGEVRDPRPEWSWQVVPGGWSLLATSSDGSG